MNARDYFEYFSKFASIAYAMRDSSANKSKMLEERLYSMIDSNFHSVILGFIYSKLEKQIKLYNEKKEEYKLNVWNLIFSFDNIYVDLVYEWFSKDIQDNAKLKIKSLIENVPFILKANNQTAHVLCKTFIEGTDSKKEMYLIYIDLFNEKLLEFYKTIYSKILLQKLKDIYKKPSINFKINNKNFSLASDNNFLESEAFCEISQHNIERLVENIVNIFHKDKGILLEEELGICLYIIIIQKIFKTIQQFDNTFIKEEKNTDNNDNNIVSSFIESDIRNFILNLFKKIQDKPQEPYFYTKEKYIDIIKTKYSNLSYEKINVIFKNTLSILPKGISRFIINYNKRGIKEKATYFIALNHIPGLFKICKLNNNKFDINNTFQRHLFLFIKKIFQEYESKNYNTDKISNVFNCDINLVKEIKKSIETTNKSLK